MKAAVIYEHGGAENLVVTDVSRPTLATDEVLIKVYFAALNRLDIFVRNGSPALRIPLPHISGSDFTGKVVEVGSATHEHLLNKLVVINAGISCNKCEQCLRGEQSLCDHFSMIGEHSWGGLAEYAKVPAANVLPLPAKVDPAKIAAGALTTLTAWRMLSSKAQVKPGQIVLIPGAGGGLSSVAIQIAKLLGARVFAVTSSAAKEQHIKSLGADKVFNYKEDIQWGKAVWQATGKKGVDVVFESVGQATWEQSLKSLKKGGKLVTAGATSGYTGKTNIGLIFWKQLEILGSTMANHSEFVEAMQLLFEGRVQPIIDKVFPLEQIREAEEYLESGQHIGKILIKIE